MRAVRFSLILLMLGAAPLRADEFTLVNIRSEASGNPQIHGYLLKPEGAGPFPAIVALHGCGGLLDRNGALTSRHTDWARRWRDAGYAVLLPDSFGSRGHASLCKTKPRPVKVSTRVGDVRGAADWFAAQPYIDPKRIVLLGWSNGGTTLLRALAPNMAPARAEFIAAIAFYPGCRTLRDKTGWAPRMKPLILMGAADDWTPPGPCRDLAARWGAKLILYEGAYHGFDAPHSKVRILRDRTYSANGDGKVHAGTNPEARKAAITEVMAYLKTVFATGN